MNTLVNGKPLDNTAHEIEPGKLTLRSQSPADTSKLVKLVASDRRQMFIAHFVDQNTLVFEPAADSEAAAPKPKQITDQLDRLMALSAEQLQVEAAKCSVDWDSKASRDTMIERIAEAMANNLA